MEVATLPLSIGVSFLETSSDQKDVLKIVVYSLVRLYKPEQQKQCKIIIFGFVRVVLSYLTSLTGFGNLFGWEAFLCKNMVRITDKHLWV